MMPCVLCLTGVFTRLTARVRVQLNFLKPLVFSCNITPRFCGSGLTLFTTIAPELENRMRYVFDALLQATFTIIMGGCVLFVAIPTILML